MDFHTHFGSNPHGRDFVIGDLHGMVNMLHDALDEVNFHPDRDRCFSVGDLVDRGVDSLGAAAMVNEPWFHAVRGNHEDMMIRAVDGERGALLKTWRTNGGGWGLKWGRPNSDSVMASDWCRNLPFAITLDHSSGWRIGICHAQCPVTDWSGIDNVAHDDEAQRYMLWGRDRLWADNPERVRGIDLTVHGHTVIHSPVLSVNALFIDTGAAMGGELTLLCLDDWLQGRPKP